MSFIKNTTTCMNLILRNSSESAATEGVSGTIRLIEAFWMIFVFGIFASLLAAGFTSIRKYIYKDKTSLDISFDAGGKVNAGLTATTVISQWTWAATLLQSSTVASKYGISGPFWYAAGASIQILLFSMLSVQLKIRAPGAKTFLQVIKARFGSTTHKTFCVFALLTNLIVTSMLMLGGAAVMKSLVDGISVEYATVLVTTVIGTYTFIGGLGATFYVSYFNTAIIYIMIIIFIMKIYNDPDNADNPLGSMDRVYRLLDCSTGPEENEQQSFLTILSQQGLMFGIINIVGNFGTVFVDQSYWQSSVASKPRQGVIGFLTGGLCWFAIPFGLATTTGLAYIALSANQNQHLLSESDVSDGLVPAVVAEKLLGKTGSFLIIIMILMAVTSTGSAEVMAVTSILIYDVYQLYLKPYRAVTDANSCILCGRSRGRMANPRDHCKCESMTYCKACFTDDKDRSLSKKAIKPPYRCSTHGSFREYTDFLSGLKNWCMLWTILSIIPLTIFLNLLGLSLGWLYLFMGVLIGSAVVPIALSMFWERLTGVAMIAGSTSGTCLAFITWLSVASTNEGGLTGGNFFKNTGKENAMLAGNLVSILSSGLITIVVSLVMSKNRIPGSGEEIWENTRDIDNPLSPWTELYARDLNLESAHHLDKRPSLEEVARVYRGARYVANFGAAVLSVLLIIVWPSLMVAEKVFGEKTFERWVITSIVWTFIATLFAIITPVVYEIIDIHDAVKNMRTVNIQSWTSPASRMQSKQSLANGKPTRRSVARKEDVDLVGSPIKNKFTDPNTITEKLDKNETVSTPCASDVAGISTEVV